MNELQNEISILNDLIEINNDRVEGYIKASEQADMDDVDLKTLFANMANRSRQFADELKLEVTRLGGEYETGTTNKGKIYRVWMDVKKTFATNDRQAILESCEFGEDAAQDAYEDALTSETELDIDIRQLLLTQQKSLLSDHDLIKKYRDAHQYIND